MPTDSATVDRLTWWRRGIRRLVIDRVWCAQVLRFRLFAAKMARSTGMRARCHVFIWQHRCAPMTLLHRRETRRAILAAADKARQAGKLTAPEHRQLRRVMFLRPGAADELCELIEEDLVATGHLTAEGDTLAVDWDSIIDRILNEFLGIIIEFIKSWLGGLGGN